MNRIRYHSVIYAIITACFLLILLACQLITVKYASGDLIFMDDFSSSENHWDIWNKPDESAVSYLNGGLMMIVSKPNSDIVSTNNISYPDVIVRTTAEKKFGPNDNVYGVVCRYLDDKNYYGFLISSDGYYGIVKIIDGDYSLISSKSMEYSELINRGKSMNHLEAKCEGSILTLSVNDSKLGEVRDSDLKIGRTGVVTGSLGEKNTIAVIFDDFVVMVP